MVTRRTAHGTLAAGLIFSLAGIAPAQETPTPRYESVPPAQPAAPVQVTPAPEPNPAQPSRPKVHHAPVSTATAHETLVIRAEVEHPELVHRVLLVYRIPDGPALREVEFLRASDGPYAAQIPAEDVKWPNLAYTIEIEPRDGPRLAAFASRNALHTVEVPEDLMDIRERALLERLGGRRSVFSATGEYVSFGTSQATKLDTQQTESIQDRYYRIEAGYTYRPLRWVTEFSVRAGIVRGKAPVAQRALTPGISESERYDVGLNYGAPTVRFRLDDQIHVEAELLSSITEVGFSWGGGGAILLGDPYGSKLTLGFETIQVFGTRFYSRMDVVASHGIRVAPIVETTNMPSAKEYGLRLLSEIAFDIGGGFSAAIRGGYQARAAASGGPSGGATLSYAF
jgi:hypothetical protein